MAQQQPRAGFNFQTLPTATKILAVASVLYLIDLFLAWNRICFGAFCGGASGIHGVGILNLLLDLALIALLVIELANVQINLAADVRGKAIAGVAAAILLFTIIKILVDLTAIYIFAWIGLILAAAIGYGGYMRWQESKAGAGAPRTTPPAPPAGGGFSS